ncbi:hypothetical protein K431DRAFT_282094 [Polychaeton citri CBS 116435]|uniref:M serotype protein n=1 Tax=Polychaeton citri CBS 116435 TaxID=1314669 RepID=A0A9P4QG55_9PEZI|nr:hypothetical protein K431DRAFT_282094 [Polychaeton citri CBS 116435]
MATIPPKKSTTPSHSRRPSANPTNSTSSSNINTTNPNRSPSRMSASGTATATGTGSAPNGINRARSVRSGVAPPSARAAARKPAAAKDDSAAEVAEARAEMNAKLEELQEQLQLAEDSTQNQQKQASVLQLKLDDALKEQSILDERVHEQSERIEELENEKKESLRARREFEQIYENERAAFMKEKEENITREEELQASVQRMKETLAQREMRAGLDDERKPSISRNSSFRRSMDFRTGDQSPGHEFAPSSMQRSDSRSSSKLVMQKDKIIEGLRLELAEAQIKLVEMENMGGGRLQELERTMYDVKMQNARLMEENESFQLLLSEKTLNGDFSHSEFLRPPSPGGIASTSAASRPTSRHANTQGNTLADELGSQIDESEISMMGGAGDDTTRKAQGEINSLRDQNKALTLYINNIISRLLQHEQFEQILDKTPDIIAGPHAASRRAQSAVNTDKDLPPPPPPKDSNEQAQENEQQQQQQQSMGFLQRARSVVTRPKPRPLSQATSDQPLQNHLQLPNRHENPTTAPQIPLGRSQSVRGGHRRANSEWAAGVVGNMYRGPANSGGGPISPGLGSPRERNSFFGPSASLTLGGGGSIIAGSRMPSGAAAAVPSTIAEKESLPTNINTTINPLQPQQQQRDSKILATTSSRNSVQSTTTTTQESIVTSSNEASTDTGAETSAPTSPPRSITSSGDRDSRVGAGGAIMMGTKMRPLRLVQEAAEEEQTRKQANRGSWFGWMNKGAGGTGAPGGSGRAASGEGGQ